MNRLRLLALTTSYPLHDHSAAGVFVRRLYENLPDAWQVTVLCPADARRGDPRGNGRVEVVPVSYAPRVWQVLSQNPGGVMASLRENPARWLLVPLLVGAMLVHALRAARAVDLLHANWTICGAIAAIAGKLAGRPVVTTLRGDDVAGAGRSRLMRTLLWLSVKGSDAVACVSEPMAQDLRKRFPQAAERIFTCLNGIDEAFLTTDLPVQEPEGLRLVAVGSLIRRKGYDVLLEALARLPGRSLVSLKIAGDGPERERLIAQAAELGIGGQVTLVGELAPDRIPRFLATGEVFVLSSRSEGRPNVVLEAMASGLPVVSTILPGVSDLVLPGENGWLVPVDDVEALVSALQSARQDARQRVRMGSNSRERVKSSGWDWEGAGLGYDSIFRSCIDARRVAPA